MDEQQHSKFKMANNFSQVNLTQDINTGDWEFAPKNSSKRRRHATSLSSNYSPDDFEGASNNTKLSMIFEEILNLKVDQASSRELLTISNHYLKVLCGRINGISSVTNQHSALLKTLSYKSIDIESRSRRNNLIFRGLKESRYEKCSDIVLDFLANMVQVETRGIVITRAHRLGPLKVGQRYTRPIIVNFMNYNDVEYIMANAKTLKNCPGFSIDRDLPKEIVDARKRLWGVYKDTKKDNPNSTVRIVYPAKLMCGGRVIRDEFPDWHSILNKSRIAEFPILESLSADVVAMDITPPTESVQSAAQVDVADVSFTSGTVVSPVLPSDNTAVDDVLDLSQRDRARKNVPSLFGDSAASNARKADCPTKSKTSASILDKSCSHTSRSTTRRPAGQRRAQSVSIHRDTRARTHTADADVNSGSRPVVSSGQSSSSANIDSG